MQEKIKEILGDKIKECGSDRGQYWIKVSPGDIVETVRSLRFARENPFDFLVDICGVDNFPKEPRFEVVYHLLNTAAKFILRIKVEVPEGSNTVPSIVSVWKAANWLEREAYDMYGINFLGHPDLRRILMHEDYADFPLRKDFPLKGWREKED